MCTGACDLLAWARTLQTATVLARGHLDPWRSFENGWFVHQPQWSMAARTLLSENGTKVFAPMS
jgi:hypothetical protein